ncbi:glyoxal reductase-like [Saccostrea echinata]|uniref:glyoxal reductase-like n=1 Tax=Saccostrea echinata TaxID=191078 RepID=UPI002A801C8F|nr:glyoxal reductase-like [Saccostrea echinata]
MNVTLRNGNCMPFVGLGTFKIRGKEDVYRTLKAALETGYRSVDTAAVYRNEAEIGQSLHELLPTNQLKRSDIFITSKLGPKDQGEGTCYSACLKSLSSLGCQYLDLYLIHWPGTQGKKPDDSGQCELRLGSWKDLIQLQKEGKVKNIGVSNFLKHHIQELYDKTGVYPEVLQTEHHPHLVQTDLIQFCKETGIFYQAYSSLGTTTQDNQILTDPVVLEVSRKLKKSVSQILLRWAVQQGIGVLPKSCNPKHIQENIDVFSFQIPEEDMHSLNSLNRGRHYCWNPKDIV